MVFVSFRSRKRKVGGAKIIDRLAYDLKEAFPDMQGFSPPNLMYMRAFAMTWPDSEIVQEVLAQLPWYHNIALIEKRSLVDVVICLLPQKHVTTISR